MTKRPRPKPGQVTVRMLGRQWVVMKMPYTMACEKCGVEQDVSKDLPATNPDRGKLLNTRVEAFSDDHANHPISQGEPT